MLPNSSARVLVLLAITGVLGSFVYSATRRQAETSRTTRTRLVRRSILSAGIGAYLAFGLPHQIRETPGSPASLVAVLVLWVIGGGLLFLGLAALLGAWLARPPTSE